MKSLNTYPIKSQAAGWLHCADMFLRNSDAGLGNGICAIRISEMRPSSGSEDLAKEASS